MQPAIHNNMGIKGGVAAYLNVIQTKERLLTKHFYEREVNDIIPSHLKFYHIHISNVISKFLVPTSFSHA